MLTNHANLEPILESEQIYESGYGDVVPWSDYPANDWQDQSGAGVYGAAFSSINDRQKGRNYPIYYTEQDLARMRARVRRVIDVSEVAKSVNEPGAETLKMPPVGFAPAARSGCGSHTLD